MPVTIMKRATMQLLEFYQWDMLLVFYALAPQKLQQPIHLISETSNLYRVYIVQSSATSVWIRFSSGILSHTQTLVSPITLTESALSSPRAAEPGAAAFSRSARARSFFNCPAFQAALFPFSISSSYGSEARERQRERIHPVLSAADNRGTAC